MDSIDLWGDEMPSNSESNMAGSEVKDQFVSQLSSKHLCHFFSFCTFNQQKIIIL